MEGLRPARVIRPGIILRHEIEARGWAQKDLAEIIGRPQQAISEIVRGTKQITPETALELSEAFGTSPEFWMNLETNYRLHLAAQQKANKKIARKSEIYGIAPVSEMTKRGWIKATRTAEELEEQILSFLGISSLDERPGLVTNFSQSKFREPERFAELAWIKRCEQLASAQSVAKFESRQLRRALPEILKLSKEAEYIEKVPTLLLNLGVHFVIVPHLPKTYVDGAMIPGSNPTIALTLRHDRLDNFWFTLMHEIAHVLAGNTDTRIDEKGFEAETEDAVEAEANNMARDWLIDPQAYHKFVTRQAPYFSGDSIVGFALSQHRHPSIVLGRLQHDGKVDYKNLRRFHVKVQDFLKDWIDKSYPKAA